MPRRLLCFPVVAVSLALATPAHAQESLEPCAEGEKATVSLQEGANTEFNLNDRRDDEWTPPIKFSGCDPGRLVAVPLEAIDRGARGVTVTLESRRNGVGWLRLAFDEPTTPDGRTNGKVVVNGERFQTTLIPFTVIDRSAWGWWMGLVAAAWAAGAALSTLIVSANSRRSWWQTVKRRRVWIPVVMSIGSAASIGYAEIEEDWVVGLGTTIELVGVVLAAVYATVSGGKSLTDAFRSE